MQVQRSILEVKTSKVVIDLPESFVNHRVELIALTLDEPEPKTSGSPRRRPHPAIAGKGRATGDIVSAVVDDHAANVRVFGSAPRGEDQEGNRIAAHRDSVDERPVRREDRRLF